MLAAPQAFAQTYSNPPLAAALKELEKYASLSYSFCLMDAGTGKKLYTSHADKSLPPASTMKIATTAAALGLLGEEYTFKTVLELSGKVENGVLLGDVYIRGGGDPCLGSERIAGSPNLEGTLDRFRQAIEKAGIKSIKGRIIADASYYEDAMVPPAWPWEDLGNYYGAGASGLSIAENTLRITFAQNTKEGQPVQVLAASPDVKGITFISEVTTGPKGSGDNAYVFGAPYSNLRYIRGTIPPGVNTFTIKGSLPDPALTLAQWLEQELKQNGCPVSEPATTLRLLKLENKSAATQKERRPLYTHSSPPLKEIVKETNINSVNLFAEHLLKECGRKVYKEGSREAGLKAVKEWWKSKGLDTEGFFMEDGSGLSRTNAISATQLAQMLHIATKEPFYNAFYASLPVAGRSGAMRYMGRGTAIEGKMHAKSGHMERIRSYAGYTTDAKGRKLCYAIIVNNYNGSSWQIKQQIEKVLVALTQGK